MSAVDQTTDQPVETTDDTLEELAPSSTITLDLGLDEAEALHAWLLKPAGDGTTSLDDQLVSRVLARLGLEVSSARATVNVRQELIDAGLGVEHLSDDQVRELGRRIAEVAAASIHS